MKKIKVLVVVWVIGGLITIEHKKSKNIFIKTK